MRTIKLVLVGLGTMIATRLVAMSTFRALEISGINELPDDDDLWMDRFEFADTPNDPALWTDRFEFADTPNDPALWPYRAKLTG